MESPAPLTPPRRSWGILFSFLFSWMLINALASAWIAHRGDTGDPFRPHMRNIPSLPAPVDVLFCGNSFSSSAIQPSLLARELPGCASYNHSLLVGGVATAHIALDDWLETQKAPPTLVWTISHFEMSGKPSIVSMRFEQRAALQDLPWVLDSGEARGVLLQYVGRNVVAPVARDAPLWTQWLRRNAPAEAAIGPDGAQPWNPDEPDKDPAAGFTQTRAFYLNLMTNGFVQDRKTAGVITSFKKRCDALGIRLVILAPPVNTRHAELFHDPANHDWAWQALQSACQDAGIALWDLRREFPDEDFADGVHLQKRVIPEFNRRLAARIKGLP